MACVQKEGYLSPETISPPSDEIVERVERVTATSTTSPKTDPPTTPVFILPTDGDEINRAVVQAACDKKRKKRMKHEGLIFREAKQKKLGGIGSSIGKVFETVRDRETTSRICQDLPNCNWLEEKIKQSGTNMKMNKTSSRIDKLFGSDSEEEDKGDLVVDEEDVRTKEDGGEETVQVVHSTLPAKEEVGDRMSQSPPCITIAENEGQEPIQIRVSISGGGVGDEESLDSGKDRTVAQQYQYMLDSIVDKCEAGVDKESPSSETPMEDDSIENEKKSKEINELLNRKSELEKDIQSLKNTKMKELEDLLEIKNKKEYFTAELDILRKDIYKERNALETIRQQKPKEEERKSEEELVTLPTESKVISPKSGSKHQEVPPYLSKELSQISSTSLQSALLVNSICRSPAQSSHTATHPPNISFASVPPPPPQFLTSSPGVHTPKHSMVGRDLKDFPVHQFVGKPPEALPLPMTNTTSIMTASSPPQRRHTAPIELIGHHNLPPRELEAIRPEMYRQLLENSTRQQIRLPTENYWQRAVGEQRAKDLSVDHSPLYPYLHVAQRPVPLAKSRLEQTVPKDYNVRAIQEEKLVNPRGFQHQNVSHGLASNSHIVDHRSPVHDPRLAGHPALGLDPGVMLQEQRIHGLLPPELRGLNPHNRVSHEVPRPSLPHESLLRPVGSISGKRHSSGGPHPGYLRPPLDVGSIPVGQVRRTPGPEWGAGRSSPADVKCEACGAPANFMCSACKGAQYCSTACQRGHWLSHMGICVSPSPRLANP